MRERDRAGVISRRSHLDEDRRAFNILRNNVVSMIRVAKDSYYQSQLNPSLNSRALWRNVSRLGLKGANNDLGHCSQDPDSLNSFFCSAVTVSAPPSDTYPHCTTAHSREFNFVGVTPDQVISAVAGIKSSAVGVDGFSRFY
ncbi:hypothetical protein DMENIID0001_153380 [Sergentomyia squamirostris]